MPRDFDESDLAIERWKRKAREGSSEHAAAVEAHENRQPIKTVLEPVGNAWTLFRNSLDQAFTTALTGGEIPGLGHYGQFGGLLNSPHHDPSLERRQREAEAAPIWQGEQGKFAGANEFNAKLVDALIETGEASKEDWRAAGKGLLHTLDPSYSFNSPFPWRKHGTWEEQLEGAPQWYKDLQWSQDLTADLYAPAVMPLSPKGLRAAARNLSRSLSPDDLLWRITSRGQRHPNRSAWAAQNIDRGSSTMRVRNWPYAKQPWQYSKDKLDKITSKWDPIPEGHTRLYRIDDQVLDKGPLLPTAEMAKKNRIHYPQDHAKGRWFAKKPESYYSASTGNLPDINPRPTLRHFDIPAGEMDQWLVKNINAKFASGQPISGKKLEYLNQEKVPGAGIRGVMRPVPKTGGKGKPPGMDDLEWNIQVRDKYLPMDQKYADALERAGLEPYDVRQPYGGIASKTDSSGAGVFMVEDPRWPGGLETSISKRPWEEYLLPRAAADERVLTHPVMSDTQRRLRYLNLLGW